jgi:hypothetical protein
MSVTSAPPPCDYDFRRLPAYLGMKDDRCLTTGPDSKFIAQQIFNLKGDRAAGLRQSETVFSFEPLAQYSEIERKLDVLLRSAENDDFGPVRPSLSAVQAVRHLLLDIAASGYVIPTPEDVDTDHDGQIRIAWRAGERFLELVTPFEPRDDRYIYHSENATFNIEPVGSSEALKNWLNWMR